MFCAIFLTNRFYDREKQKNTFTTMLYTEKKNCITNFKTVLLVQINDASVQTEN